MDSEESTRYVIVRPEKGRFKDLFRYALLGAATSSSVDVEEDRRWVILVSILVLKLIAIFSIPMYWTGRFLDFSLNLISLNGGSLFRLLHNFLHANVVLPERGSQTFVSTIGQLDARVDLQFMTTEEEEEPFFKPQLGNRALMDLCIMSSKLAYENPRFIQNVVNLRWMMHFVDFYHCWNDFQKQMSTQLFILCDKPKDANLILVSFRGTEPFDAYDWSTDFDYSWYEIPNVGKIHIGFLEALGLGNRDQPSTFYSNLQGKYTTNSQSSLLSGIDSDEDDQSFMSQTPPQEEKTAYDIVRTKLRSLLEEHKDAKFIVTGHSLGGALAILFPTVLVVHQEMEMMEKLLGVYTFGQPRIGNRQLGRFMEPHLDRPVPKYFRVVYCNDIVPRLPYDDKTFLYKHFGECLYYNSHYIQKNVKEEPNKNFFGMRFILSQHLNAVWELIRGLTMGYIKGDEYKEGWFHILVRIIGLAFPGFSAHCPTEYVNSIRLGKESSIHMSSI
ncbi:triacylglycerol lipase OBL1 [Trifolium pratense]|uniref:triacylglycerol lipase OBL1 n=1 Tax=Trifolium pratense TaxID=57577 RepID=UPI001E695E69|nr:triacylglycerol lipase OBL1 [Trifolium pratense]